MPEDPFHTPSNLDVLRMENELLALEADFLRSQTAEARAEADLHRRRFDDIREQLATHQGEMRTLLARQAELDEALNDLKWVLARLAQPPLRWIFMRRAGFRRLQERYQ